MRSSRTSSLPRSPRGSDEEDDMNQGRIWCVVNPTVGLPLFLGAVALIAFVVHFAVLNNVPWFAAYWAGGG